MILGHLNIVESLSELVTDICPKDHLGDTPLHLAARRGYLNIVISCSRAFYLYITAFYMSTPWGKSETTRAQFPTKCNKKIFDLVSFKQGIFKREHSLFTLKISWHFMRFFLSPYLAMLNHIMSA